MKEEIEEMSDNDFNVVGIGASAGGVDAIFEFFNNLPDNPGMAFIIVRHIKRDAESNLKVLLQKYTKLTVKDIETGDSIDINTVYILPPNKKVAIRDERLLLFHRPEEEIKNIAIDYFYFSMAKEIREKSIAVILSGTGSDGVEGVKAIEKAGGTVFVQDPRTAMFPVLPNNLIANDHPDFVMPPSDMPQSIIKYAHKMQDNKSQV